MLVLFGLSLPYWEYWVPLVIGLGIGLVASLCVRAVFYRPTTYVPRDDVKVKQQQEYDPFVQGSPTEQRKSQRRMGNPTLIYYSPPDKKNTPNQGWVLDRSVGGMALCVPEEVASGTVLAVLPLNAPPMTPWVDLTVRSCRKIDNQYELGCQFVKVPPWSIMLMFG